MKPPRIVWFTKGSGERWFRTEFPNVYRRAGYEVVRYDLHRPKAKPRKRRKGAK